MQSQYANYDSKENLIGGEMLVENLEEQIGEHLDEKTLVAYGQIIAERNYIDERLRKTLQELSHIKSALDQAAIIAITDEKGIIRYVNDKVFEISRYTREELIGKTHRVISSGYHSQEFFKQFWFTIRSGKVWQGEIKNRAKDGSDYWVNTTVVPFLDEQGNPYQYLAIRFDITERKRAEEALRLSEEKSRQQAKQLELALQKLQRTQAQLVQSEKMSSLGQLVAGIAHEINNPVNFIYGNIVPAEEYTETLISLIEAYRKHYPQPVPEIQKILEDIDLDFLAEDLGKILKSMDVGAKRISEIVLSLRNFSCLGEAETKLADVHRGIENSLLVLGNRLKGKGRHPEIIVNKEYGDLPAVMCYPSQLNQVFMNVLCNAIDSLEEQAAPRVITIKTKQFSGNCVLISIANNGPAIPESVQPYLFDPFFTTKPVGKGPGLGLSIAQDIVVDKHKGQIKCISRPGKGVEFLLLLPIVPSGY